jgi:two-component system response regulator YesN
MEKGKKYTLLIAEDNPREEREMVRILKKRMPEIVIIGSYPDGEAALTAAAEKRPDIILSDIVMPKMNGVRLAEKVRQSQLAAQIIFTSCHNDFDFAKSAIDLRVHSYVLKPVMEEELISALEKAVQLLTAERKRESERTELLKKVQESKPLLREQFLRELFFSAALEPAYIENNLSFLQFDLPDPLRAQIMILSAREKSDPSAAIDEKYIADFRIQNIIHSYADRRSKVYSVKISDTECAVAVFLPAADSDKGDEKSPLDVCIAIKEEIDEDAGGDVKAGISTEATSIMQIPIKYKEAVQALRTKFAGGPNRTVLYEDIETAEESVFGEQADLQEMLLRIRDILELGQNARVGAFIEYYLGDKRPTSEHYVKNVAISVINLIQIVLTEQNAGFDAVFGKNFRIWQHLDKIESITDLSTWLENIFSRCIEHLEDARTSVYDRIVNDIKDVVREKCTEPINVSDIAALVHYSPSQANVIFKNSTGTTIFDYLSECRLEKAKELLSDPYSRVYLVADAVGYKNKSHFCLQFKKYTGLSPSQYKDRVASP